MRIDPETGLKRCSRCKTEKEANAFSRAKDTSDKLCNWCRECQAAYVKTTYNYDRQETGEKTCTKCKETSPVSSFPSNRRRKDGLDGWCRECAGANARAYYIERSEADPKYIMIMSCRARAKKKSLPCTISEKDISIPDNCPVCDRPLIRGAGRGGKGPSSPSLDMWDPTLGYTPGNTWIICDRCNMRKQDMSGEDHIALGWKLIEAFKQHQAGEV